MTLAEKVLKGLECCDDTSRATLRCEECPYRESDTCSAVVRLHRDALELLKTEWVFEKVGSWMPLPEPPEVE